MVFNRTEFSWCIPCCKHKKKIMDYSSTRGKDNNISFVEAMLNGLAKDGGLYVPKKIKKLTNSQLLNLSKFYTSSDYLINAHYIM